MISMVSAAWTAYCLDAERWVPCRTPRSFFLEAISIDNAIRHCSTSAWLAWLWQVKSVLGGWREVIWLDEIREISLQWQFLLCKKLINTFVELCGLQSTTFTYFDDVSGYIDISTQEQFSALDLPVFLAAADQASPGGTGWGIQQPDPRHSIQPWHERWAGSQGVVTWQMCPVHTGQLTMRSMRGASIPPVLEATLAIPRPSALADIYEVTIVYVHIASPTHTSLQLEITPQSTYIEQQMIQTQPSSLEEPVLSSGLHLHLVNNMSPCIYAPYVNNMSDRVYLHPFDVGGAAGVEHCPPSLTIIRQHILTYKVWKYLLPYNSTELGRLRIRNFRAAASWLIIINQ